VPSLLSLRALASSLRSPVSPTWTLPAVGISWGRPPVPLLALSTMASSTWSVTAGSTASACTARADSDAPSEDRGCTEEEPEAGETPSVWSWWARSAMCVDFGICESAIAMCLCL